MAGLLSAQLKTASAAGDVYRDMRDTRIGNERYAQQRKDQKDTADAARRQANIQAGLSVVGAAAGFAMGGGPIGASVGATIGNAVGSLFSDERTKEDVKKVGTDPNTGLGLHEFQYKDDPTKSRYVGVMAGEVQKVRPDAVSTDPESGMKKVNYSKLGLAMRRVPGQGS